MSSPSKEMEEPTSTNDMVSNGAGGSGEATEMAAAGEEPKPPAKRRLSSTVIEISDTESDDSDICAVTSYQASADEVKRIRGDYSSTSSSSSDYSSDSDSPWEDDSTVVEAPTVARAPKLPRAQLLPRADRGIDPKFNPAIKSQDVIDRLKDHWKDHKDHSSNEVTLTCEPFRLCLLHDLLANSDIINNIVDDMNTLDWSRKKMDLYEFHQTTDLASLTWQRGIKGIYELLKTEVMSWVSQVTGLELTSISASCSLYGPGDHLLVHDDRLADRRVAFILYLAPWRAPLASYSRTTSDGGGGVENGAGDHVDVDLVEQAQHGWMSHMGGALELFSRDPEGRPKDVVHSVYPRNNMLAFFQVGPDSFHQVSEVVSLELPRLSINGWFHGPPPIEGEPPDPPLPDPPLPLEPHNDVVVISSWVAPTYMSPRVRAQVQHQMERDSELCLTNFLPTNKHGDLLTALRDPDIPWETVGPANQRHYSRLPQSWTEGLPSDHVVKELLQLVGSAAFCRVLADCTDLQLASYEGLEIQRWRPTHYTLLPPRCMYQHPRLELQLHLGAPPRAIAGGHTTYVAPEDGPEDGPWSQEGALVTIPPSDNTLSLVYCDAGAASFTKYLSTITLAPHQGFYVLRCTYREAP